MHRCVKWSDEARARIPASSTVLFFPAPPTSLSSPSIYYVATLTIFYVVGFCAKCPMRYDYLHFPGQETEAQKNFKAHE